MRPFSLLAYETYYRANTGTVFESAHERYDRLKKWYDELCYAQVNPETASDFEEIKFLQSKVNCDQFLLMKQYFEAVNN